MTTRFGFVEFAPLFVHLVLSAIKEDVSGSQLFICKSCNSIHSEESEEIDYEKSEGAALLNQLKALHQEQSCSNELDIQAVGCLWTCDVPALWPSLPAINRPT